MSTTFAFFVVVEYVSPSGELLHEDVGYSNDVEPEDFYMAVEEKDWTRLTWYTVDSGDEVFTYDCPVNCSHSEETLIDESPTGCEYGCTECGFVRFEPHDHFR